jgi:hypothetical protein
MGIWRTDQLLYYSYVSGRLESVKDDPVAIERTLRELQGEIEMRAWYGIWWWTYED